MWSYFNDNMFLRPRLYKVMFMKPTWCWDYISNKIFLFFSFHKLKDIQGPVRCSDQASGQLSLMSTPDNDPLRVSKALLKTIKSTCRLNSEQMGTSLPQSIQITATLDTILPSLELLCFSYLCHTLKQVSQGFVPLLPVPQHVVITPVYTWVPSVIRWFTLRNICLLYFIIYSVLPVFCTVSMLQPVAASQMAWYSLLP